MVETELWSGNAVDRGKKHSARRSWEEFSLFEGKDCLENLGSHSYATVSSSASQSVNLLSQAVPGDDETSSD